MKLPLFLNSLFRSERHFASYDQCPEIYYRINDGDERGPQQLVHLIKLTEEFPDDIIKGRFSDETRWRSAAYFLDLWHQVPPSANTVKRLTGAGLPIDASMTEERGREVLRERLRAKPPTPKQLESLKALGVDSQTIVNREQASEIIGVRKAVIREKERDDAAAQQRADDAPEVERCLERLSEIATSVNEFLPAWRPATITDLEPLSSYVDTVAEALEYAVGFDLESLYGGPFFDPLKSEDFYLEFSRDPTADELRRFQAAVFVGYLAQAGEDFDHVSLLRRAFPSVTVSRL